MCGVSSGLFCAGVTRAWIDEVPLFWLLVHQSTYLYFLQVKRTAVNSGPRLENPRAHHGMSQFSMAR